MKKVFYLLFCMVGLFGCIRTEAAELNPEAEFIAVRDTGRESRKKLMPLSGSRRKIWQKLSVRMILSALRIFSR